MSEGLLGGINTYAYVNGNPISASDPLGLWTSGVGVPLPGGLTAGFQVSVAGGVFEGYGRFGFGARGFTWDPEGTPTKHAQDASICKPVGIARLALDAAAEFGIPKCGVQAGGAWRGPNAVTTPEGNDAGTGFEPAGALARGDGARPLRLQLFGGIELGGAFRW